MADITLSAGVRQNLLSLQNTADIMAQTQNRLATGKKVNSALDNPSNFFTSQSLQSRASEMSSLLDAMANGVKTLEAADNGLSAITQTLESMQSTLRQARQDKSFETESYVIDSDTVTGTLDLSGGALSAAQSVALTGATSELAAGAFTAVDFTNGGTNDGEISFDIEVDGGAAQTISIDYAAANAGAVDASAVTAEELAALINTELDAANVDATVTVDGGDLVFTTDNQVDTADSDLTITNFTAANGATGSGIANGSGTADETAYTVDQLVTSINNDTALNTAVRASNDNGNLRIENLSTQDLDVTSPTGVTGADTIEGNSVRAGLSDQFNELKDQLDKLSDDASYNGVNLLRGDNLKITFNETGTSTIEIQTEDGETINSASLGLSSIEAADLDADGTIDDFLTTVKTALNEISSQSSTFGSNLSIVENRQEFTKNMVNTLETGADNLVLADMNEEAANMMALQTRQQLSSSALSLASQSDQNVLQLLR